MWGQGARLCILMNDAFKEPQLKRKIREREISIQININHYVDQINKDSQTVSLPFLSIVQNQSEGTLLIYLCLWP